MRRVAIGLIKLYRFAISPMLGSNCRFHPSCSSYAEEAFDTYGFFKGGYLTARRLIKCHPLHPGGYDPVVKNNLHDKKRADAIDKPDSAINQEETQSISEKAQSASEKAQSIEENAPQKEQKHN